MSHWGAGITLIYLYGCGIGFFIDVQTGKCTVLRVRKCCPFNTLIRFISCTSNEHAEIINGVNYMWTWSSITNYDFVEFCNLNAQEL